MQKFRLRKGLKIGDLAAENDKLLNKVFIDQGHIDSLLETDDPCFLILGRTGSGKTALIKQIKASAEHVSLLNPEELSMQYIHNSQVLRTLASWGVNLEIFYKFLWRHVCVLEIIRMRYGESEDLPSLIQRAIALVSTSKREEQQAKKIAQEYVREYGEQFWVTTDTRIKKIVDEIELRVKQDEKIAAQLGVSPIQVAGGSKTSFASQRGQIVERELIDRAQTIVTDYLIADLRQVIELLGKAAFNDAQKQYYLLVDDLDKNWMPDDALYLDLTKSLLQTVSDLNRGSPLKGVKVIVALRENIYHRVFQKAGLHEPQREKWLDVQVRLRWRREELEDLVDRRLAELYRGQYTQASPRFKDILPVAKKRERYDPLGFILDRTFMRPRDVIDFVNTAISDAGSVARLTWANIHHAEIEYSKRRRQSVFDEWKDSYYALPDLFPILTKFGPKFTIDQITVESLESVLIRDLPENSLWLRGLQETYMNNTHSLDATRVEILKALYLVGLIGVKQVHSHQILYSFDQPLDTTPEMIANTTFHVHKMFWSSLGLSSQISDAD